jgi:hypothetical protein
MKDVIELLDSNNIEYIYKGENVCVRCLNPLHNDSNPSMSIRIQDGLFNCWSCGYKGNLYKLNLLIEGKVDRNYNFNIPIRNKKVYKKTEPLFSSPKVFGNLLSPFDNNKVLDFLHSIGFLDEFIELKDIKYTTYSEMVAEHLSLDSDIFPTRMNDRICIPIYRNGKLINYECRSFGNSLPKVKYVKGCNVDTLYNWENIDKTKPIIVTESIKNLAKIWQVNKNVVSLFHAIPTKSQMELLNQCDNVILFLDNDKGAFGEEIGGKFRKGGLQSFADSYKKDFKICWDKRTYKKMVDGKLKICGYDANDCTLNEISNHLDSTIWYSDYLNKNTTKRIIW